MLLIKHGRLIDPGRWDGIYDILIEHGKIADIAPNLEPRTPNDKQVRGMRYEVRGDSPNLEPRTPNLTTINASGKIVVPGLIDMHVHFREPGEEYKETIETGCLAAVHGGFTAVCTMPNTKPVNDNRQVTEYILRKAYEAKAARVYPVGAISKGLEGNALSEYGELKSAGAVAVSDDGKPVTNSRLMRKALEYAKGFGLLVISHCEDLELAGNGVMNEGVYGTRLGLAGIPNAAESVMVMRDIALCELTRARLHIAHVSTAESVAAIREAKKRGAAVTAETAPHYFTLTEAAVGEYDTHAKMNPPLRSERDREAVIEGLADGTLDVIATDHAPHSSLEKDVEFDRAANGIIGLETSLSLSLQLVEKGVLTLPELIEKMSLNPARILGLDKGLKKGSPADITLIDPERSYIVNAETFRSRSRNTPFNGMQLKGCAVMTIVDGNIVFDIEK